MQSPLPQAITALPCLFLFALSAVAQPLAGETSLSAECRVPLSELYTLAPLPRVRLAFEEHRPISVLALGPASGSGNSQGGGLPPFPVRLERELGRILRGAAVAVAARNPREITPDAIETIKSIVDEIEPDLLVWQVGIKDLLDSVEVASFSQALDDLLKWFRSHDLDVVLVEPPYTSALANNERYAGIVAAIRDEARQNEVALIRRSAAMRFLSAQKAAENRFDLQNLGYHCTAEHVRNLVALAVRDVRR